MRRSFMEELVKQLYLFLKVADEEDVFKIHVKSIGKTFEFSYQEVVDLLLHNKIPERIKKEVESLN